MLAQELDYRPQTALLWPIVGYDDHGDPVVSSDPVELKVRWDPTSRIVDSPQGTPIQLNVSVVVDRDIAEGSIMWLGSLLDIPGTGNAPTSKFMKVVTFDRVPDLKGRSFYREVGLVRWNETELPVA